MTIDSSIHEFGVGGHHNTMDASAAKAIAMGIASGPTLKCVYVGRRYSRIPVNDPALEAVDLTHQHLGEPEVVILTAAIDTLPSLRHLRFGAHGILSSVSSDSLQLLRNKATLRNICLTGSEYWGNTVDEASGSSDEED